MVSYEEVSEKIKAIEMELRRSGRWQSEPLPGSAYENMGAFGMNTMAPEQWIQFVLIPRVNELIATKGEFPKKSSVGAWAVRHLDDADPLSDLLCEFDSLFRDVE